MSRSSSASSIRNTVSPNVPIISDPLPTSPKLDNPPESINLKTKPKCENPVSEHEYYKPESAEWTLQRVVTDDMPKAVGILRAWMPTCRSREATEETVEKLRVLNRKAAVEAVKELKKRQKFIRGTKGKDMKLSVTIENLNTGAQLSGTGLVDSGATGTCINKEYVEKHELETQKLPIPTPVYNADGTLNEGGAIESYVEVRLVIGDHAEKIEMAVVNLGKTDFFLGLDWLRYHNPNIDWEQSTLTFDRCPD